MTMTTSVRRFGVAMVGLVGAAILAAGCSSDSNGTPPPGLNNPGTAQNGGNGTGHGGGNQGGGNQGGGNQGGGGTLPTTTSAFCKDFTSIGNLKASDFTSPEKAKQVVQVWERLADEAPPQIKSDVQTITDFLKSVQAGNPDMSKIQKLGQMNLRIAHYVEANC